MARQPQWARPARQAHLVKVFLNSGGFCVYGHTPCRGSWQTVTSTVCGWGKPCNHPQPDMLCKFKPEDGKPHLPCQVIHLSIQRWKCAYGDYPCYEPYGSHYEPVADRLVKDWIGDDRAEAQAEYRAETEARHKTNDRRYPVHGRFSAVSKDIYYDQQPEFRIEGLGMSGLTLQPFAKVRLASSPIALHVDLENTLRGLSKCKKRKALRYGKIPKKLEDKVETKCWQAVKQYLNR